MPTTESRNPLFGLKAPKVRGSHRGGGNPSADFAKMDSDLEAPGARFFFWLGQAARRAREDAGVRPEEIAVKLGRGKELVVRFELGRTRPQELEVLLAAYAVVIDLDDPRDLVADAVRLWYENGEPPTIDGATNNSSAA